MSEFAIIMEESLSGGDLYEVLCCQCGSPFDATAAQWCNCALKLHTLKCPRCASCFCQAPFLYKHKFWAGAPRTLRESSRRFGLSARAFAVPAPADDSPTAMETNGRPHILVVDDEEPVRSLVACYIEQIGYRATTVSGPEEALALLATSSFDAVLTDALMPRMDGRELCREIKERHGNDMKVIVMTSLYKARHFQTEARHVYKVDEFLGKPLRYDELRDALHRVAPIVAGPVHGLAAVAG